MEYAARVPVGQRRASRDGRRLARVRPDAAGWWHSRRRPQAPDDGCGAADDERPHHRGPTRDWRAVPRGPRLGFGGSVDIAAVDPWNVPGRYGWVGGTG